ncbi:hypothetical protein D5F01_LYC23808 [Scomber scombrus]|uniref:Uncharacterized protein n=1 Tax=Scomber scombrus TaxID=13677 RepID=A0AAV1QGG4_SCOSC
MPKKNKSKAHLSQCEEDDVSDAISLANSECDASLVRLPREDYVDTGSAQNMDVIQILDGIRNDFSTKIDVVLKAIQDVKRDVQDFSTRMDEAEVRISTVEDTVNSEKGKADALAKQLFFSPPPHGERRHHAAERQAGEGGAGQQEVLLSELSEQRRPPPQEVVEQRLLLGQRAERQEEVEELVAVADDVIAAGGETLRYGAREEESRE